MARGLGLFKAMLWAALFGLLSQNVFAQFLGPDEGKLLATGGLSEIDGAGGGGLTPWALITGYGSRDSYGANLHASVVGTQNYQLTSEGVAVGLFDRVEASFANQRFSGISGALDHVTIKEEVTGLKLSLLGDAVIDQDSPIPQLAVGAQYHQNEGIFGLAALGVFNPVDLGARQNSGTDYYLSATKIYLAQSLIVNLTLRDSDANQFGLLGYGGPRNASRQVLFEGSLGYLLSRHLVAGMEYRQKPHDLVIDDERGAYDVFLAWFPTHNFSLTAAYVNLGTILKPFVPRTQDGFYLSSQVGF